MSNEEILACMSREDKVLLVAIDIANSLVAEGYLKGGYPPTEQGKRIAALLIDSGFKPTQEEFGQAVVFLCSPRPTHQ